MADRATHPTTARWLAVLTGLFTLVQIEAARRALQTPPDIAALVSVSRGLEVVASIVWGLLFAAVTIALLRRIPRAIRYAAWYLIGYLVYSMARLAIFIRADYDQQRLPFLVVLAGIILLIPTFFVLRTAVHPTENRGHGRKSQD
jgi:hypothetical protein